MYYDNTDNSEPCGSPVGVIAGKIAAGYAGALLYYRAQELWDALPEDLPESVYERVFAATNECLAADDRSGLEVAYAAATTRQVAA